MLLKIAAFLTVVIGIAHSYLGERYILIRLFRRGKLPSLFNSEEFTKNTLRFAWHLTTIAWFGFAIILLYLSEGSLSFDDIANIIAATFLIHGVIALVGSKGKHFS